MPISDVLGASVYYSAYSHSRATFNHAFGLNTFFLIDSKMIPSPLLLSIPLAILIYQYIIYPIFRSPLSKIPAIHPTAPLSPAYILRIRRRGVENVTVNAAHERLGPLVRLGPNEISVNCVNGGIRTVRGSSGSYIK